MSKRLCYGCMQEVETDVCPHCGWTAQQDNERHQLPVGTVLADKYIVGRVLGQGGFGITYLGLECNLNLLVCIKEFFPHNTVNRDSAQSRFINVNTQTMESNFASARERFIREAKSLAKFRDVPQIVSIYELFQTNNTAYMVMEFVSGNDMVKYLRERGGRLPMDQVLYLLEPIMQALTQVHDAGLIHRDISPDNIMIQPSGHAKLLDFGAARNVDNPDMEKMLTHSTEAIIKNGFAPMEQYATRGSLGPWTDVYAMSATIYYCVTGQLLENAPTRMLEGAELDWSNALGVTEVQRNVLERGLALNIRDRIPSIRQLMQELSGSSVNPPPPPPGGNDNNPGPGNGGVTGGSTPDDKKAKEKPEKKQRKKEENTGKGAKKSKAGLIAVLLVLLVGLGVGGWFLSGVNVEQALPEENVLMELLQDECSAIGYYHVSTVLPLGSAREVSFPVGEPYNGVIVTVTDDNGFDWGAVAVENGIAVARVPADGGYLLQVNTAETEDMGWTEWAEELPEGLRLEEHAVVQDVQYRSREKEYMDYNRESMDGWEYLGQFPSTSPYGEWSEWDSTELTADAYTEVEEQQLYRFRTNEFINNENPDMAAEGWTQIGSTINYTYGAWSDWSETPASASETQEVESRHQWQATWVVTSDSGVSISSTGWTEGGSAPSVGSMVMENATTYKECTSVSTRTLYRKRSKNYLSTTYYYSRWSDWSDWNANAVEARPNEVEVEQKQMWRSRDIFGDTIYRFWRWSDWTEWALESAVAESEEVTLEKRVVYRYIP